MTFYFHSGFESGVLDGEVYDLDLNRCAQYLADKLTDYYCAKMAFMSKEGDEPSAICKRREEQLQAIASDNSSLLTVNKKLFTPRVLVDVLHCYRFMIGFHVYWFVVGYFNRNCAGLEENSS
jgi:hypothetical protein